MTTVTIAPVDESCVALQTLLRSNGIVRFDEVTIKRQKSHGLEEIDGYGPNGGKTQCFIIPVKQEQPAETLDGSDQPVLEIRIVVRAQLPQDSDKTISRLELIMRNLYLLLDNWNSSDRRVQIWECTREDIEEPLKEMLRQAQLFHGELNLSVQVMR